MIKRTVTRALLTAAIIATIPVATAAQDAGVTPEGIDWHLASYGPDGSMSVPWSIDPTLRLEDGTASGSTACNTFSGNYTLDGTALSFEPALAMTRMACPPPASSVEDAYMAALPQVVGWAIDDDILRLSSADGTGILEYERAVVALTPGDVAELAALLEAQQAGMAELDERIDDIRIGTLRDRIKTLESQVKALRSAAASSSSSSPSNSGFSAAETVLLKAIPKKVKKTCRPLRSGLPSGTAAAVACDGSRKAVAEQAYYLMEWADAEATLESVANSKGVPNKRPRCHNQKAGWMSYGTAVGAEACWLDGGKANYRLITSAAGCKQLDVAGTHLTEPAIYLAMEGTGSKMEPVRAAGLAYTDADYLIMNFEAGGYIPAGDQPQTPGCKNRQPIAF